MATIEVETAWNIITQNEETACKIVKDGVTYYCIAFKSADYPELEMTEAYGLFSGDSEMLYLDVENAGETFEEAVECANDAYFYKMEVLFC